jgi:L-seryl-tRNA(Ser) seleniumtransferase
LLRVGKVTDVALERTLRLFLDPASLARTHPTLRMATADPAALRARARSIASRIAEAGPRLVVAVREAASAMGGGTLPEVPLPTWTVVVSSASVGADRLSAALRRHEPPVVPRVQEGAVVLDVRTLLDGDDDAIVEAFRSIDREIGGGGDGSQEGTR